MFRSFGLLSVGFWRSVFRAFIAAIRSGTYAYTWADDDERIVFCLDAGKPVTQTLTKQDSGSRWDERPVHVII